MKVIYLDNNDFKFKELIFIKKIEDYGDFFITYDKFKVKKTYHNCNVLVIEEYQKKASK